MCVVLILKLQWQQSLLWWKCEFPYPGHWPWAGSEWWGGGSKRAVAQRGVSETYNCQVLWALWWRKATGKMGRAGEAVALLGVTQQCKAQQFSPEIVPLATENQHPWLCMSGFAHLWWFVDGFPLRVSKFSFFSWHSNFLASLFSPECENSCILDVLTCIVMIFSQCLWINDIPQVCLCFHSITNHLQERLCWLKQQSSGGSCVLLMHWIYWRTMVLWVQKAQAPPVIQVPILQMGPVCSHWGLHPDQAFGYTQIRSNQKA